jgi:iron complex outermembrane recepter protein
VGIGKIVWSDFEPNFEHNYEYYRNTGVKDQMNFFGKINYGLNDKLNLFVDLQYRHVDYKIDGLHDDLVDISQGHKFDFFNPKAGLYYALSNNSSAYFSFAIANREPNRSNFRDAEPDKLPKSEQLMDFELGYKYNEHLFGFEANIFFMDYKDQLVLTGEINDVGAAIMTNVPDSYRAGIELVGGVKIMKNLDWKINAAYSQNKIENFNEFVDDWDEGGQVEKKLGTTDLAFSPEIVAGSYISYKFFKGLDVNLISKYVGKQFIDNTSNDSRSLDPYFKNDLVINYTIKTKHIKEIGFHLMLNNVFNAEYETYAWVYRYYTGGEYYDMDGYFPQAGINFMAGVSLKF